MKFSSRRTCGLPQGGISGMRPHLKKKKKKKNWKLRRNISISLKMADPPSQSSLIEFNEIFFLKKFSNLAPQKESASHVTSRQAAYLLVLAHQRQTRTRRACHQVNPIQFGRHFVSSAGRSARASIGHFQPKTTDRHSEKQKNPTRPSPHGVSKTTDQVNKDGGISSTWKRGREVAHPQVPFVGQNLNDSDNNFSSIFVFFSGEKISFFLPKNPPLDGTVRPPSLNASYAN